MHKGHFLRRVEIIIGISALALLITGLTFSSIGYQHEQEIEATLSLNETALVGEKGEDGQDGRDGVDGRNGTDGTTGAAGANGTNGAPGPTGPAGADGANGATGATGADGANGATGATGPTGPAGADGANGTSAVSYYQLYTYLFNTDGPAMTANTWNVRLLNTVGHGNMDSVFTSLASDTITFQPGTYRLNAWGSVFQINRNIMRVQDTTNAATLCLGLAGESNAPNVVCCSFTAASAINVQVQHNCQTSHGHGQGPMPPYVSQTALTIVEITKLA